MLCVLRIRGCASGLRSGKVVCEIRMICFKWRALAHRKLKLKLKGLRIYPYPSGIGLGTRGTSGTSRD